MMRRRARGFSVTPRGRNARFRTATMVAVAALAAAAGHLAAAGAADGVMPPAQLKSLTWRTDPAVTSLVIESSSPVAYLTSQPDPFTLIVDLRNVVGGTMANALEPPGTGIISDVRLEDTRAADGAAVARLRLTLARPSVPRVRSARNVIYVEIDGNARTAAPARPAAAASTTAAVVAPATMLRSIRFQSAGSQTHVVLTGNGRLAADFVEAAPDLPPRLVLDFIGVSSSTPMVVKGIGPVERVRVATRGRVLPTTRVVVDLVRPLPYSIDSESGELKIAFETSPPTAPALPDPMSALAQTKSEPTPQPAPPLPSTPLSIAAVQGPASVPPPANVSAAVQQSTQSAPPVTTPPARPTRTPAAPRPAAPAPQTAAPSTEPAPAPAGRAPSPSPPAQQTAAAPPAPPAPRPAAPPAATAAPAPQPSVQPSAPQPTPAAPPQPPAPPARPTTPRECGDPPYTGHPISLDFQQMDLRAVLRIFADVSGLNFVIEPSVNGSVDVQLRDVPWDQALAMILKSNKLGCAIEGNIVRIATIAELASEQKQRQELATAQTLAGDLGIVTRTLSYARAEDLAQLVTRSVLSARGSVQVDPRTNTLIITDLPAKLPDAVNLLTTLDTPQPQVEIEARIVETTRNFARQLGIQWGFSGRLAPELGNTTNLAFPNQGTISGRVGGANGGFQGPPSQNDAAAPTGIDLRAPAANTAVGLSLGSVNGAVNLDVALSALETSGKGRLLSTPRVSTQNNVEAEITQGVEIPIQTVANNTVTVTFKSAALTLKVTPQITAAGTVIMKISVENASPDFTRSVNNIPPINTQRANTQVLVTDGETTVIGGVYTSNETSQKDSVPGLNRIPLLGWLFKRDLSKDESRELLIFITPRIIKS